MAKETDNFNGLIFKIDRLRFLQQSVLSIDEQLGNKKISEIDFQTLFGTRMVFAEIIDVIKKDVDGSKEMVKKREQ